MSFLIVSSAALLVSALTLYSGFGLGTLLMPVFALFFPIELAIAATAVVHGANNAFKIVVVGRAADRFVVLRFGLPALVAAFFGAASLRSLSRWDQDLDYSFALIGGSTSPIKLVIAVLMIAFALFEFVPRLRALRFGRDYLPLGGLLSGFFGGLSGHQGALRSAFLTKAGLSTAAYVGTNAAIGLLVDLVRVTTYATLFLTGETALPIAAHQWPLIGVGTASAFIGVLLAKRYLKKVRMNAVQTIVGIFLIGIAIGLATGFI